MGGARVPVQQQEEVLPASRLLGELQPGMKCGTHLCPCQGGHVHDDVSPQVFASVRHPVC